MMKQMIIMAALGSLAACATTKSSTPQPVTISPAMLGQNYDSLRREAISPQARVQSASLWSHSPDSLFGDRRARGIGDILTVMIDIDDEADLQNSVSTDRQSDQSFSLGSLFGLAQLANDALPDGASLDPGLDLERDSSVSGNGQLRRRESMTLTLAAQVTNVTPNGDLAIAGYQEVRVDGETRLLGVTGIIRREDISRRNVVTLDKIANASVTYGGRGVVNRQTKDKIGHRAVDAIIPF